MISFNLFNVDLFNFLQFIFKSFKKILAKYDITVKDLIITECKLIHVSLIISMFLLLLEHYI